MPRATPCPDRPRDSGRVRPSRVRLLVRRRTGSVSVRRAVAGDRVTGPRI